MLDLAKEPPSITDVKETSTVDASREAASALSGRLLSLDVFRGLTIAGMVLVNNAGNWDHVYGPLRHAEWHGWTPTDLIFPFFVFIVGVAIPLAFQRRVEQAHTSGSSQRDLYLKIVRRSLLIFFISLVVLHGFPYTLEKFANIRIPGVLQRIAVCYFFAAIIFLKFRWRGQAAIAAALLFGYWLVMKTVAAPGYAAGDLTMEGSLASWVDRTLLAGHIYKPQYDPEGILSTVPAIATCLAGVLAGQWLMTKRDALDKVAGMFGAGALCVIAGWCWNLVFPINKALWTSSYVVFTAGLALQLLALCYWAADIKGHRRWTKPLVIFGVNALALYVLSGLMARVMDVIPMPRLDGTTGDLKEFLYERVFATWLSPVNASLAFALAYVLLWLGVMTILYRRRIFIKV
jgi:predicted acyltransferase